MSQWNFLDPASRDTLLALVHRESEGMFSLVNGDAEWLLPTGAGHWQARDVVGHLVDTTETYFIGFDAAQSNGAPPPLVPLLNMAKHVDAGALQFRHIARSEMLARLRADRDRMAGIFQSLSDEQWSGLMVPHKYMGPLPASFYAVFQLVDYAVHSWDIRQGKGTPHGLAADAADMLVPLCFILWTATAQVPADTAPFQLGLRITCGANAGDSVVSVSPAGVQITPGPVDDLPAVMEFDPASFVLTAYGRVNAGTLRGDVELASGFLTGFFRI
jgi:uncharacterized protein (TIGR03083 family)